MQTNNYSSKEVSPWIRGFFILGWSMTGVFGAVMGVQGYWWGWGSLFFGQVMVFLAVGWPLGIFTIFVSKFAQALLLFIGLGMTVCCGVLIILAALP